ncbi:extracellular catalytic domain type 1 short-chain-length polyhydroxyalkanoate depolymerase [Eisenibacter elegans]|uniref:extracellular catalytic domain type 1 short-chain-length polyhydroxyalkanoate depolymerase n=1 Tax=Eisenibacter elegans TaxID=997 RepID=UPI00041CCFC7|nr:PHB depolymerase family esterase [Eisenibacter elegans]
MKTVWMLVLMLCSMPLWTYAQLVTVNNFGSNPGNLTMFRYSPAGVPANAPLVVVLHGCTQTAAAFANETEWNKLADTYGFHLVYPEQKTANNSSRCFNWFENGDISRGQGEALSIKQMVDFMKNNFSIDASRVFVTGLSAGGAMTTAMCAAYPEIFAAGAPMAGLPYRAGVGTTAAFQAMSPGVDRTPQQWGDLVRQQFPSFSGNYPKMVVFHGSQDFTVRPMNMIEIAEQWTNVAGANATVNITNTNFDGVQNVTRRVYLGTDGQPVVITYELIGMGHAISVNPGNSNPKQGGQTGGYSVNRGFWSSYWAADFFGLLGATPTPTAPATPSNLAAAAVSASQINLTWADNSNNEDNFVLERSTSATTGFAAIATLPANTTSFSNTGLNANTTYYYRVRAANAGGSSAFSNTASATTQQAQVPPSTYTIAQPNGNFYLSTLNNVNTGQSITTLGAGQVTQVKFRLYSAINNSTLHIYVGNTVSGSPAYSQSVSTSAGDWQTFTLSTPFEVSANTQYTIILTNASVAYTNSNAYSGGHLWYNTIAYTVFDAAFEIVIAGNTPGGEAAMMAAIPLADALDNPLADWQIYPNPCSEFLRIRLPEHETERFGVQIYDSRGRQVRQLQASTDAPIDLRQLPSGAYQVIIQTPYQTLRRSLMIQR